MDIAGWDQRYRSGELSRLDPPTPLLVAAATNSPPGKALDLACGSGRHSIYLATHGWDVTALDGSEGAISLLIAQASKLHLAIDAQVADLTNPDFTPPPGTFDLVLIAFYLNRDLFTTAKSAVRTGGLLMAIAHIPDPGEPWTEKRAAPGELRSFFNDWQIIWDHEGPSRDPAHKRRAAELLARRIS